MPAFPGHLRAASITRAPALALLLHHYDMYEPVKASARDVQGAITGLPPTLPGWHRVAEVRRRVESFARRWNLDRIPDLQEASYARIRTALKQLDRPLGASTGTLFEPYSSVQYEPESPRIVAGGHAWTWHLARGETLAQFRQRIMEELQVSKRSGLAPDLIAGLAAMPDRARDAGWTLEDTRHGVEQHAAWLFLRLCPQPDRVRSARVIAGAHADGRFFVHERSVRVATVGLARSLQIDLPPLPRGRPRKTPPAPTKPSI